MAEVNVIRLLVLIAASVLPLSLITAQEKTEDNAKKKVEIHHTDLMTNQGSMKRLLGNVRMKHKETFMTCDSAHYFENNLVEAYSKVHIYKGDSLHLYGEYLLYDANSEFAHIRDSVILIDNETTLYTNKIDYDIANEKAMYDTGGKIINKDNTLTSIIGTYYTVDEIFHFKDSVKLVNPDYEMFSDTLKYNTITEIAYFLGPSRVIGDSLNAKCNRGWFDTKNETSLLLDSAYVNNLVQIVNGDSIYYDSNTGFGTANYNVTISDLENDIIVKGDKSWYTKDPEKFMITDNAQFIQINDDDNLYLHADTLRSVIITDSIADYRLVRAYYGCRIFSDGLQSKCDSLSYSFQDSVIKLYYKPVLWSDENQLFADSVSLFTKNSAMDKMELYNSTFIIEKVDSSRYNQLKGNMLIGYFTENKISKIEMRGNSEKIYFAIEENALVGVDQSTCEDMDIYFEDGKMKLIYLLANPEGTLDPPLHIRPSLKKLTDFQWYEALRPKNRYDIFREINR